MPELLLNKLKQNPKLVAAYSSNLHKSGLLYQLQTIEELERSYQDYQNEHGLQLARLMAGQPDVKAFNCVLLIFVVDFTSAKLLATLKSVNEQYTAFDELIIWCDARCKERVITFLREHARRDFNVITHFNDEHVKPLLAAKACFIVYEGDVLHRHLGYVLATTLQDDTQLAYVDTDTITDDNKRQFPDFKPDWNPDLQLTNGYISSGLYVKSLADLTAKAHFLNLNTVSIWLCEYYLSGVKHEVVHIPQVLLFRPEGDAHFSQAKDQLTVAYKDVADVIPSPLPALYLRWHLRYDPLVSIIIPTRNGLALVKSCIESILDKTTYSNYEILLIDNGSDDPGCINYFKQLSTHSKITVFNYAAEFNYSAINNFAAKHAKGEVLALVNNDIEVIEPDWLLNMVSHVMRDDIGCVGAKLLYSDNRIQHAGVVLGYGGGAGHGHKYFPSDHYGYMNRLVASQNYSAVTAACLLVKTDDFWAVGGLNEEKLAIAFNDVDFCLKVLQLGKRNLYCAEAVLYHHESVSRGHEDTPEKVRRFNAELNYLQTTWCDFIANDPAYNPNLTRRRENFAIKPFR
ncbi:glycosyl transferase, family 2 [Pseudoalteromonas sp. BSi20652]|uniref:glycosyltransferase family 2 protein n=1 Tax=Pseudoalteromonas sp. BSi20652 TaxID=388384 RepID=UPI0002319189|nr:glycosyltransferase family 2 protein [Pseudoalteromonas sp. BSi20652]GAA61851.1 glycosyl transferase, family 2 [Pseudoalteromonas sp. BSi20652]